MAPVELDNEKKEPGTLKLTEFSRHCNFEKLALLLQKLFEKIESELWTNASMCSLASRSSLPLALQFVVENHMVSVGFNPLHNKWIVINSGYPYEVSQKDMAIEMISILIGLSRINISTDNNSVQVGYDEKNDQWYRLNSWQSPSTQTEIHSQLQKLALKLSTTSELNNLDKIEFNLHIKVYGTEKEKAQCEHLIHAWLNTPELQEHNQINPTDMQAMDTIFKHSLLYFMCKRGDIDGVKECVRKSADANKKEADERAAFIAAINSDEIDIVKFFLEHPTAGPNLDKDDFPLLHAVFNNNVAIVKLLLQYGANINALFNTKYLGELCTDRETISVLELAVMKGMADMVPLLLKQGAKSDLSICNDLNESNLFKLSPDEKTTTILKSAYQGYKIQRELIQFFKTKENIPGPSSIKSRIKHLQETSDTEIGAQSFKNFSVFWEKIYWNSSVGAIY